MTADKKTDEDNAFEYNKWALNQTLDPTCARFGPSNYDAFLAGCRHKDKHARADERRRVGEDIIKQIEEKKYRQFARCDDRTGEEIYETVVDCPELLEIIRSICEVKS